MNYILNLYNYIRYDMFDRLFIVVIEKKLRTEEEVI